MQILKGSILYRFFSKLLFFYRNSFLNRIVLNIVKAYKYSVVGKCFKAVAERESTMDDSVFIRMTRFLLYKVDKSVMRLSSAFSQSGKSGFVVAVFQNSKRFAKEKLFPISFAVFGLGYLIGRMIQNRLRIRDLFFLGLACLVSAVFMVDREKRKAVLKESLTYQLFLLVLG